MRVLGSVFGCKLGFGKHFVPRQTSHAHTRTQTREMEQLCRQQGCQVVAFQAFVVTVLWAEKREFQICKFNVFFWQAN